MITLIKTSLREYKYIALLTPLLVTCEVILECLIPFIMINIIDGLQTGDTSNLLLNTVLLLIAAIFALIFGVSSGRTGAIASTGFAKNLREDIYYNIQEFSFEDIDKFSSSSLVTRLTTDITNIQNSFSMLIRIAVRVPLLLIVSIIMAFIVNSQMALIFVIVLPILGCFLGIIIKTAFPIFDKIFPRYDKFNKSIQENIKAIRVVKSFAQEDYEKEKFEKSANNIKESFIYAEKIVALNTPAMTFSMYLINVLIFAFGSLLIVNTFAGYDSEGVVIWGQLSTGELQSLLTYSSQTLGALMMFSMIIVMLTISRTNANRVKEVILSKPSMDNKSNALTSVLNNELEFKNVSFKYDEKAEKYTLENINFKVEKGQSIGIIGGTGSGKTTLISLIPRLYDVSDGQVLFGGEDIKNYDIKVLRDNIAVVLQKNVLFSGTIKDNLLWGNENATDEEIYEACKNASALDFIESFPEKFDTYLDQGGTNVSGGQKQRLCIARALLKNPKIIILDDSTSAVDTKTDSLIKQAFSTSLPNTTKLIIAQRISSIDTCDYIIVMEDGKINGIDTHSNLLKTNEIYKEIYEVQMQNKGSEIDE